jgi:hypothetical protein
LLEKSVKDRSPEFYRIRNLELLNKRLCSIQKLKKH